MEIASAQWADAAQTAITATIDGEARTVPDVADNIHRQAIAAWVAEGNAIADYVAPPAPARRVAGAYFRSALINMDLIDTVRSAITDPVDLELFNTATEFNDQDADVNAIATALDIDLSAVFDAAEAIRANRG
ncbi:hypothetical protein [Hoeflea sp.]|uniref:hypothetical protein n=1 Tax=Hoeflea sp. TaxID=1940281 RepID=UPI003B524D63